MMNILKLFKLDLKYYLLLLMPLLLVVSSCDNSNPPAAVTLTGITISPSAVPDGLPIDVTQQFTATGSYSNNSRQDLTKTVAWNSSVPATATINANGLATGVATGSSNITASQSGVSSNSVAMNVINPGLSSLVVTPAAVPNLVVGRTQSFKADGVFDNNKSYDVTQWVDWKSSNLTAATIAQTGVATGVLIGTTNITAESTAPAVTSNTVALEVILPAVNSLIIEPQTFDPLPVNRKQQFKALLKFDGDFLVDVTNNSTWTSSNTAIATVVTNPNDGPLGQVTGVATGDVTITATDNTTSLAKTVNVTVNDATITAVNVAPSNPDKLPAGYSQEFTATGTFTDGKTRKLSEPTAWTIDDTTIAMIEKPLAAVDVRALKPGEVKVSYNDLLADGKASGKSGSSQLTVTDGVLLSIAINPNAAFSIPASGQTNFTALGTYSDVARDITSGVIWESDNTSAVVVDSGGKLTALSAGVASVLAKAQNTATPPVLISSAAVNVTVIAAALQSLTIQPQLDPEVVGFTRQYSVTGAYTGGSTSNYTQRATWSSSDPAIFTVSNDVETKGQVTGVAAGIATLTAKDPETGISDTLSVTVSQP